MKNQKPSEDPVADNLQIHVRTFQPSTTQAQALETLTDSMAEVLDDRQLRHIKNAVLLREETQKKPLLGICLGMQLLFEKSCEYGEHRGLGLIPGEVCPLADDLTDPALKVPHIGWNAMDIVPGREADPLFKYVKNGEYVYYVHSYYAKNCAASTLATSDYSIPVTGAVRQGLVYGTQFHPEKSGDTGLRLLKAFAEL